ncbi:uncharacterized protein [Rutidosis leptorrhynchoides]|uniref:uncharacterized protein n=1 Tax=Rutidosis leptorrhynchoides TaxID=125765 RepID=UPI003A99BC53
MKPEKLGRMAIWAIKLGEHEIEFQIRHSIKGQVLADFIAETIGEEMGTTSIQVITPANELEEWKLFTDGASSSEGSGVGLMLISPEGKEYTYTLRFKFSTTNNEAEYEALLAGLRLAKEMNIRHIKAYIDSQLVVNQYLSRVRELAEQFKSFVIENVRRSQNKKADALSNLASITFEHLAKEVLVETLGQRSIEEKEVNDLIPDEDNTWMKPLKEYLRSGLLPADKKEARKIRIKAPSYKLLNDRLYRKSFLTPWLRCVGPSETSIIIQEMHEGICGFHAGPRSIVAKIIKLGYYWPTMHQDTVVALHACESFWIHANIPKQPKQDLISVLSAWPFAKWGIDIVGPLTAAPGGVLFLVEIVLDNGKQFAEGIFLGFCERLKIKQTFTSVYHPQGNGQVEVTNKEIIKGIKKRLGKSHEGWVEELPLVLWAHMTTPKRSNGETPYSLVNGTKAVLPAEIQVLSSRTANTENTEENLRLNLDLAEERREAVLI